MKRLSSAGAGPLLRELTGFLRRSTELLGRSVVPLADEAQAWQALATLEYLRNKSVTYDNTDLPFGSGARERTGYTALGLMLSAVW